MAQRGMLLSLALVVFQIPSLATAATDDQGSVPTPNVAATASAPTFRIAPSPLLAVDQNRPTVVDRIVGDWGDALATSGAGLSQQQLRVILNGLRSDQLLAASLAGSLDGLRDVIANALLATAEVKSNLLHAKALGDTDDDLVYTPVTPCREVDTRPSQGGTGAIGRQLVQGL